MYDYLYKKEALKAAKELGYGKKIITKINETNNNDKIAQIMLTARHKKFKCKELAEAFSELYNAYVEGLENIAECVQACANAIAGEVDSFMQASKDIPFKYADRDKPYTTNFKREILFKSKVFISRDAFIPSMKKYRHNIRSVI